VAGDSFQITGNNFADKECIVSASVNGLVQKGQVEVTAKVPNFDFSYKVTAGTNNLDLWLTGIEYRVDII
jgi:hypothetical protein